ncbi:hypothetical protein FAY30_26655 (plasmid) [Bacillus sp. S3]|uniref:hypothetical protein n=1 Tax=Bacillus sp. S3 TaxID=486398 RepID=UPI00118BA284|nr:hypothetical protein [Bacillus sp. S3]QCJ45522.1 hypothetical protein FAY30_26655 [Bacillus sp. S3]
MSLHWQFASNDPVARKEDKVFRLHENYLKVSKNSEEEYQVFSLQIRKVDQITFKDLGYHFYAGGSKWKHSKSVDGQCWDDIKNIINRTEEILKVLGFIY